MTEPGADPEAGATPEATPEVTPEGAPEGAQRQLDRAPGERYRGKIVVPSPAAPATPAPSTAAAGSGRRAILAGIGMAAVGALFFAALGQIELGPGFVVIAVFIGWMVALAFVWGLGAAPPMPRRRAIAGLLGAGSIVVGLLLAWAWARAEGGVLDPLDYTGQVYGPIAYAAVVLAGTVAAIRVR